MSKNQLPCPHDGSRDFVMTSNDNAVWSVNCKLCGAATPYLMSLDAALELWNRQAKKASDSECPKCGEASVGEQPFPNKEGKKGYAVTCFTCGWHGPVAISESPWILWANRKGVR